MKKVLYLVLLLLPSLVSAQSAGRGRSGDRLLLPTTPRRYYSQKNHQRLLALDRDMALS